MFDLFNGQSVTFAASCSTCGKIVSAEVHEDDWNRYNVPDGPNVQDVWPEATADFRDVLLVTKRSYQTSWFPIVFICSACLDSIAEPDEDE